MSLPPKLGSISMESLFVQLISRLDAARLRSDRRSRRSMRDEIRTLEFWRAIIAECLSTFFYVFLLCATHISWSGSVLAHQPNWLVMALTSGLAMATLSQCFGHISGAHVNPAVTCAQFITSKITLLRAVLYIVAQCGGSIAGAALLYGVSVSGHSGMGPLGISVAHDQLGSWQIFSVEFVLTFLLVFTIFATLDPNRKSLGSDSLSIGIAYLVCSLSGLPASGASMNPARTLGPSFVMNRWKHHWVYWLGPVAGGTLAGLIYEFIFDTKKKHKTIKDVFDDFEKDSNPEDDYEDPDANINMKINNRSLMASATYSTSGTSTGSSSGHPSTHTQHSNISIHAAPGGPASGPNCHYDNYRSVATINAYSSPAVVDAITSYSSGGTPRRGGGGHNYHQNNSNHFAGIYNSRGNYHNTLREIPVRIEYNRNHKGNNVNGLGNSKF